MTRLAKWSVGLAGKRAAARFEEATRSVAETQQRKLTEILQRNASTEYGMEYGFSEVRTLKDLARAVPVIEYDDIADRVKRMTQGEPNVLTAEAPVMFARTSGTTGEPKFIPVTPTCQGRDHADQMRTWMYHAQKDHPDILRGKVLTLVSPAVEGHTKAGIPYGSTSGFIYKNMPAPVQKTYLVPYEVFEIEDYEAKYYVVMRLGLSANVTFLCTANPSSIAKLCEVADAEAERLLEDLREGTLRGDLDLSAEVRRTIESRCAPDPARARKLQSAREQRGGRLLPADFWPGLALIGCWKGGTVGSYLERFPAWFCPDGGGDVAVRDWGYLSSEARGSIPLSDEGSAGVLTVGTNVYEFVEAEEVDENPEQPERWQFLGAHEIEAPRDYYVFITTTGGLYRYDINDIVRVVDYHNQAPVITFQRKGRGMTSITGEKVSVNQIVEAFTHAAERSGVALCHFKALADAEEARYVFQVECETQPDEAAARELLRAVEDELCRMNLEYKGKRESLRLEPPRLLVMEPGWYDDQKKEQGQRLFQSKTVVLAPKPAEFDPEDAHCRAVIDLDGARSER